MILFELTESEDHPAYQELEISNGLRHYDFLRSIVQSSIQVERPFLSQTVLKALNYHAIACLHTNAGDFRPCEVTVGEYQPPAHFRVQALMDDFVNMVNLRWEESDAVALAAFILWRLNHIHPFINGNGRTARAACYFVLCVKSGGWLTGSTILPELLKTHRTEYVDALRSADNSFKKGDLQLDALHKLLVTLLEVQLSSDTNDTITPIHDT